MEWIKCSEKLPDDSRWCVVDTDYGYYVVQCWSSGQGWLDDDISIPNSDVKQYLEIPEPPTE